MVDKKTVENNEKKMETKDDLTQLLDSSYPLLKLFREMCPGTHKHSQAVESIVEGVSLALELDINFMKVGAVYHDIGKMYNAKYFTENQLDNEDPHKDLDPWISYQIISRHVADTTNILVNDEKFPRKLIEMASQHHGTTIVKYFFNKSDSDVEDRYRYKCTKPTCVESAVLMICDHVEATSRSLFQAKKYDPLEVIESTINSLLDDGQLDDVYMRLGDLKRVKEALAKELEGSYQKRVDYDKAKDKNETD